MEKVFIRFAFLKPKPQKESKKLVNASRFDLFICQKAMKFILVFSLAYPQVNFLAKFTFISAKIKKDIQW